MAVAYAEHSAASARSGSAGAERKALNPERNAPGRERGRRLALVRAATDPMRPKTASIRRWRIDHARPDEALREAMDTALDATPSYALRYAGQQWMDLLDSLKAHIARRTAAGRAEADYARQDDE